MIKLKKQPAFYFIVVVWGDEYVDMLLRISLPCFLSPLNIPALNNLSDSRFLFVTTKQDYSKIVESSIFKKLETYIQPILVELDMSGDEAIHFRMTMGYELASNLAYEQKAYAVYLLPDCLVSNGTFLSLEKYAHEGKDVVLLPGPRVIKEKIFAYVNNMQLDADEALCFSPRKLAAIGLDFLHTEFRNYNYTEKWFTKWPQMVSWNVPGQRGLLIRAFHLHPLMVNFSDRQERASFNKNDTIDANFIKRNFLDINKIYLERDSDNMILYSMTNAKDRIELGLITQQNDKLKAIINISQSQLVNALQKIYFYNAYMLHCDELGKEWFLIEKDSLLVTDAVLNSAKVELPIKFKKLRLLLGPILPKWFKAFLRRLYWKMYRLIGLVRSRLVRV